MENMYERFKRIAAKSKNEESDTPKVINEPSGIGHLDVPKPPTLEKLDLAKMRESYDTWREKAKRETGMDADLGQDPRFAVREEQGDLGALDPALLNVDTLIDLDANMRAMVQELHRALTEWKELRKKWDEQKKAYDTSYEKLEEVLWDVFTSVMESGTAKIPQSLKLEYINAKERAKIMNAQSHKINEIREKAKEIHDRLVKSMDQTTGYIMESYDGAEITGRKIVRVLLSLVKLSPTQAANLHLAALNSVFAKMEAKSDQAKKYVDEMRKEIEKAKMRMVQKYQHDEMLGMHLYEGDSELLLQIATDMGNADTLAKIHKKLENPPSEMPKSPDAPPAASEPMVSPEKEKEMKEMTERLLPPTETEVPGAFESSEMNFEDASDRLKKMLRRHKAALNTPIVREAMGIGLTEMIIEIGEKARALDKLVISLESYCDSAIHQLEARGIEIDLPKTKEKEEEMFEEETMHEPSFALSTASKKEDISKKAA